MGLCASSALPPSDAASRQANSRIDKAVEEAREAESKVVKVLLLGTGESGKSTLFKQMQVLYTDGFNDYEKQTYRHVVRRNVVQSMQTLLQGATRFGFRLSSPDSNLAAMEVLGIDVLDADFWTPDIVKHIKRLWEQQEEAVVSAYQNRSRLQLPDCAAYMFDNIDRIGDARYTPTTDDILRARMRTSGIVERTFRVADPEKPSDRKRDRQFKFLDVGGQRNERRKWIHCFENVTAIIFVAALSEYDQVLYEDETSNRMHEALVVFATICENKYFLRTDMVLFLNKVDLFQEKIATEPLTVCFPEYDGPNTYEDAAEYIQGKFEEIHDRSRVDTDIYVHLTCATDTNNFQRVFLDCRVFILKRVLGNLGLA